LVLDSGHDEGDKRLRALQIGIRDGKLPRPNNNYLNVARGTDRDRSADSRRTSCSGRQFWQTTDAFR